MRVHELVVTNFRGIGTLRWRPTPGINCLIGPGDSTKTTVLDALSLVLAHRWNVQFSDADFYFGDPANAIDIEVTLVDLPDEIVSAEAFGQQLRGVTDEGEIVDDPISGTTEAITLALTVNADLEPVWSVRKDSDEEPRRIKAMQRQVIPAVRIDDQADEHLRWTRTSALTRMTTGGDLPLRLAEAQRAARRAVFNDPDPAFKTAAETVAQFAREQMGVDLRVPQPGLDPDQHFRAGSLALHDGELPASALGLGSRRLLSLSAQSFANDAGGILFLDEVEAGLEPHRVRFLIDRLVASAGGGKQIFTTTHSPTAIQSLDAETLRVTRSSEGKTSIVGVPAMLEADGDDWQSIARAAPQALLASRIVVCEGKTEMGLVAALVRSWDEQTGNPAVLRGVATMFGNSASKAPNKAQKLAELGYDVALFVDHDDAVKAEEVASAVEAGCTLVQWDAGDYTELAVSKALPQAGLQAMLHAAVGFSDADDPDASIRDSLIARLPTPQGDDQSPGVDAQPTAHPAGLDVSDWIEAIGIEGVRTTIGRTAGDRDWFKTESRGIKLGQIIIEDLEAVADTGLGRALTALRTFTHPTVDANVGNA